MNFRTRILPLLALTLLLARPSLGDDRAQFESQVDLAPLRTIAVQQNQTIKTLDTFARQVMEVISGHSSVDGHDALYCLLDMSFRPEAYVDRNIIKIVNVPLRQEFLALNGIDDAEKQRIVHDGTVSLNFLEKPEVQDLLQNVQAVSVAKSKAIDQVMEARSVMQEICQLEPGMIPAAIIAPPPSDPDETTWRRPFEMVGDLPDLVAVLKQNGSQIPAAPDHYDAQIPLLEDIFRASGSLLRGWDNGDAPLVNQSGKDLASLLPNVNPQVYPSLTKRQVEVIYNRLLRLTIPAAAFYFAAFVLFLMASQSGVTKLRLWGLRLMVIAFAVHSLGIGIRWWLVGGIFPPIKNEFESVMFSAWFGALVGLILELRRSRGIFGAAASFIGMLSLVAIFAAPYVTGREIGGEINPVQGILMSYWLYIHVTMVTASYALIGMSFLLSVWWLIRYYKDYAEFRRAPGNLLASDAAPRSASGFPANDLPISAGGGAAVLSFTQTLAMTFFFPIARSRTAEKTARSAAATAVGQRQFLATLDQCNLVVLQLAFWMLGAGIMFGAIWADQSWGRPWGWDPKETFALVTWIVYLIIVHIRVATTDKAWWTSVLACCGFFVMLFNWIGVNFLLVGLHSYA